jgi:hypothetical protein
MSSDTDMQGDDDRAYGTVAEVAAAYGVSPDTIRRRMKRGELKARRETIPSGYRWLLPMPAPGETLPGHEQAISPALEPAAMVATLQHELQARNAEIERLHHLLDVQARALEAIARPALPETATPQGTTPPDASILQLAVDTAADPGERASGPAGPWQRVMQWLGRK